MKLMYDYPMDKNFQGHLFWSGFFTSRSFLLMSLAEMTRIRLFLIVNAMKRALLELFYQVHKIFFLIQNVLCHLELSKVY